MTPLLTHAGYLQTREKLVQMEARLAALRERADLHPSHRSAVERSYLDMIRQYRREIKLYEATNAKDGQAAEADQPGLEVSGRENGQQE